MDLQTRQAIDVLPPFLNLRMAWNDGINFGLDIGVGRWVLIGAALVISALVLLWVRKEAHKRWVAISAGFLIGGALGNVVDRILYGAVADFLNMSCCGITNPFAFNVADVAIFVGAVGLVLFTGDEKSKK
jgi:signal peptidase II